MRIAEFRLRIVIIKNHSIRANPTNIPHPPASRLAGLRRTSSVRLREGYGGQACLRQGFEQAGLAHRA